MEGRLAGGVAPWFFCGRAQWGGRHRAPVRDQDGKSQRGGSPSRSSPASRALPVLTYRRPSQPPCSESPARPFVRRSPRGTGARWPGESRATQLAVYEDTLFPGAPGFPPGSLKVGSSRLEDQRQSAPLRERSQIASRRKVEATSLGLESDPSAKAGDGPQLSAPLFPAAFERISWHT
jgi:hypothetical protein